MPHVAAKPTPTGLTKSTSGTADLRDHHRPDEPRSRPHVDIGTEIEIPNNKLKWDRSNPTGHGILFLSHNRYVFCYVQPGGV